MLKIGLGGIVVGCLIAGVAIESSSPGSTQPAAVHSREAANNLLVTLGGMTSDAIHVVMPVAADALDTARTEFPNVLGETPAGTGGTAQHPPAADPTAPQP
jgi:hypothetical protein